MIADWQSPQPGSETNPVSFVIIKGFMRSVTLPHNGTSYVNGDGEVVAGQGIVAHRPLHITSQIRSDQGQINSCSSVWERSGTLVSVPSFNKRKSEPVMPAPSLGSLPV